MSKTHIIDGKTYVEVERKAKVGDLIVNIAKCDALDLEEGQRYRVGAVDRYGYVRYGYCAISPFNYHVLDEVGEESPPESLSDIVANLVRRVSSLESQLRDTQNNVERQGVEIAEVTHLAKSNEADIRDLDERTQPKPAEPVIEITTQGLFVDGVKLNEFTALSIAKKLNGGERR